MEIPKKYQDLVGKNMEFSGGLFSGKKAIVPAEFKVLDIRVGDAKIVNLKELKEKGESSYEHPTFELLLKNDSMTKSRWSRPFPIREINLKELSNN